MSVLQSGIRGVISSALAAGAQPAAATGNGGLIEHAGPGWFVSRGRQRAEYYSEQRGFALIAGAPTVRGDPELARLVRERGVAAACTVQYLRQGPAFLAHLDGPFALAIHSPEAGRTLLAVD